MCVVDRMHAQDLHGVLLESINDSVEAEELVDQDGSAAEQFVKGLGFPQSMLNIMAR